MDLENPKQFGSATDPHIVTISFDPLSLPSIVLLLLCLGALLYLMTDVFAQLGGYAIYKYIYPHPNKRSARWKNRKRRKKRRQQPASVQQEPAPDLGVPQPALGPAPERPEEPLLPPYQARRQEPARAPAPKQPEPVVLEDVAESKDFLLVRDLEEEEQKLSDETILITDDESPESGSAKWIEPVESSRQRKTRLKNENWKANGFMFPRETSRQRRERLFLAERRRAEQAEARWDANVMGYDDVMARIRQPGVRVSGLGEPSVVLSSIRDSDEFGAETDEGSLNELPEGHTKP